MLKAERLAAQRGGVTLFANLAFELQSGEALVVTGANGSGKTTLLRMVAGLTQPHAGRLSWRNAPVASFDFALRAATLYIGHAAALKDELNAEENLLSLATLHGAAPARSSVREALREWSLGDHALDASGVKILQKRIDRHLAEQGLAVMATHQPLALTRGAMRSLEL